jgi:sugar (pentulose or hexulose) kinase
MFNRNKFIYDSGFSYSPSGAGSIPVIAIFDIGKTNKKLFLFDEQYQVVFETSTTLPETVDEDGDACEDIAALTAWIKDAGLQVLNNTAFSIKAMNFSTYGASFVYVNEEGKALTPLYNYLKPFPPTLKEKFYSDYGGEENFSVVTASPVLGSLNSGMQLYRLKYEQPEIFKQIKYALHLPQYISYLITNNTCSDITSIGCHTNLWNFQTNHYHDWVINEGVAEKLAPVLEGTTTVSFKSNANEIQCGIGLHDSSAALIPYLINFHEPFVLISTGTWCISLNPFNNVPLTAHELQNDCLCYMSYHAKPVKASRLFAGYEHEETVKKFAAHFNVEAGYYKTVLFDASLIKSVEQLQQNYNVAVGINVSAFASRDLNAFNSYKEAYHQFMYDIIMQQKTSTSFILNKEVTRIFVDGGFSKNAVYMNLLATAFPEVEVFAASIPQSTARGAALAIHNAWNNKPVPSDLIELKYFKPLPQAVTA